MNRTGKTNAKKGPHDEYNAFRDFHEREIEAHILASFMTHIGARSLEGQFGNITVIMQYCNLYHAIESTTNQNTGKLLYIRQYYIQPSHCALWVCRIDCASYCIFYGMV